MSQYEEMSLARLTCKLMKRDAIVTGENGNCFSKLGLLKVIYVTHMMAFVSHV